jgi:large repetitive protein
MKNLFLLFILFYANISFSRELSVSFTFSPNNACSGTEINFDTLYVTGGTPPFVFEWDFDDSNFSDIANPTHIFDAFGCNNEDFSVSLTVTDTTGGGSVQASHSEIVTVKRRPNPELIDLLNTPDFSNCYNNPTPQNPEFLIEVDNITSNPSCIISDSYSIDWGDASPILTGLSNSDFPIEHLYTELGAFNLIFSCLGTNDCQGSTIYVVKNESNPAIGLGTSGSTEGCTPITFSFSLGDIFINNSPYTVYEWNFGDGSPPIEWDHQTALDSSGIIHHTYLESSCLAPYPDYFTVTITATNSCSSTQAAVNGIVVWSKTEVIISTVGGCAGQPIEFDNLSLPGYGPGCTIQDAYYWDFGDGNVYTGQNPPSHTYYAAGVYTLILIGSSYCGADTLTMELLILEPPTAVASANPNSGCVDFTVDFINESTGDSLIYLWTVEPENGWEFVEPASDTSKNPVIEFQEFNEYIVTLKTSNVCDDSFDTVMIHAMDIPKAIFEDTLIITSDWPYIYNAYDSTISYYENGSDITFYQWFFPGGNPSTSNDPYPNNIVYSSSGTYTITLIVTNYCGEDTVEQILSNYSLINEFDKISYINIHPNPFNQEVMIEYILEKNCFLEILLIDVYGNLITPILEKNKRKGKHYQRWIPTNNLKQGVYFLNIIVNGRLFKSNKLIFLDNK